MDSPLTKTIFFSVLLVFAWNPLPASAGPEDLVLVLDNSGSMKKNDPDFLTGVAVRKFLDALSGDSRVAILVFDQEARLVVPLTPLDETSRATFLSSLDLVDYQGLYTDSPAAIERAIYELKVNGRPDADRSIVFMTDGMVDTGNEAMDVQKSGWLRNDLAAEAAEQKIRIFGIAFTDNAEFLLIQSLSKRTGGEYFRAYSAADIEGVFRRITDSLARKQTSAAESEFSNVRPETESAAAALPKPALLPELALRGTAPFYPDALADPGSPRADASEDETLALPALEQSGAATMVALPTLPEEGIAIETSEDSEPKQPLAQADEAAYTATPAAAPEAKLPGVPDLAEAMPSAAGSETNPSGEIVLPLWVAALIAAGAVGVTLVAGMILLVRRKSSDETALDDEVPKALLNDLGGITDKPSYELCESLTVIGRIMGSDADSINYVVIPEPTVGRRHALIEFKNHCFWVTDQNSLNGTFINDKRIDGDTRLKHGDRIRFHKHEFEFLLLDMFETDRTRMSQTESADLSRPLDGDKRRRPPPPENSTEEASTPIGK